MNLALAFEFVLLAALWGGSFLLMKLGASEFGVFVTAFIRVFLASLFLLPFLVWRGQLPALKANLRPILFAGMLNSGLPFVLFSFAVLHISTGLSSILNATVPLWGAVVAWMWLKDRPNWSRTLGLAIGFAGVTALAWDKASFTSGASATGLAVLACLAATLCYGIAASFAKKFLGGVAPLASATGSQIGAALLIAVPAALTAPAHMPSLRAWLAIAVLAALCTALAYILYFRIIEKAGPAKATTVTFVIPVFGIGYGAVFLSEAITNSMLVCGAVIILGTALSTGFLHLGKKK